MTGRRTQYVEGVSEMLKVFDDLPKAVEARTLTRTAGQALEPMAETARTLAPDDLNTNPPDDLKGSIAVGRRRGGVRRQSKREEGVVEMSMGPTKAGYPQAMPQEFGAVQHPPHPFMRPAYEKHAPGVFPRIARLLGAAIQRNAKRWRRQADRLKSKR